MADEAPRSGIGTAGLVDPGASGPDGARPLIEPTFEGNKHKAVISWIVVIAIALFASVLIRSFLLQMFWIPSGSMEPTLLTNDRVAVTKLGDQSHPSRGDIVVFTRPPKLKGTIEHLIKRVIGLPGDSVTFTDGKVNINGQPLAEPYLPPGTVTANLPIPTHCAAAEPCVVPAGHVWVMGDNRTHSEDSRFFDAIDESTIVGRALWVIWPFNRMAGL